MNIMNIKKIHNESVIWLYFIMYNISTGESCNSFLMPKYIPSREAYHMFCAWWREQYGCVWGCDISAALSLMDMKLVVVKFYDLMNWYLRGGRLCWRSSCFIYRSTPWCILVELSYTVALTLIVLMCRIGWAHNNARK